MLSYGQFSSNISKFAPILDAIECFDNLPQTEIAH